MRRVECTTFSGIYPIDPMDLRPIYPKKQCCQNPFEREAFIIEMHKQVDEKIDELLGRNSANIKSTG